MEAHDLKSASTYINNLLLARGLLRDGKTINFGRLAQSQGQRKKKLDRQLRFEDGVEQEKQQDVDEDPAKITTQVLNLVHDLILKRDRDQTQQEHTAQTILTLRTEATTNTTTTRRLEDINTNLKRQLSAQEVTTRSAESTARSAETSARILREEVARIKILLAQVRTQCANDVRKRDLELARLKAHLSGQQRGSGIRAGGASLAVVAPSCKIVRGASSNSSIMSAAEEERQAMSVHDAEYTLRQETNEFLTQLSQSLSDENDSLISLLRNTLATLKELQGISDASDRANSAGSQHNTSQSSTNNRDNSLVTILPSTYAELSAGLEPLLTSLRDLLSTPSFVSIEEVQIRDDEIKRLQDGWDRMEVRWREAVLMMQGWRRRMLRGGDTVNLDEIRDGLRLGDGVNGYLDTSEAEPEERASLGAEDVLEALTSFIENSMVEDGEEGYSVVDGLFQQHEDQDAQMQSHQNPSRPQSLSSIRPQPASVTTEKSATNTSYSIPTPTPPNAASTTSSTLSHPSSSLPESTPSSQSKPPIPSPDNAISSSDITSSALAEISSNVSTTCAMASALPSTRTRSRSLAAVVVSSAQSGQHQYQHESQKGRPLNEQENKNTMIDDITAGMKGLISGENNEGGSVSDTDPGERLRHDEF